jgi:glycosyltransferase involved in cell wall biosynthesis
MTARSTVLLIGDSFSVGGTEGQFVEVACGLDRARWDVHVTCLRAVGPLRARLEAAGLSAWSCGRGSFKSPRVVLAIRELVRYLRAHRIRLVHCFDFYSNVLGVTAARIAGVPAVIASQRELGDLRTPLQRGVYRAVMRLADITLVNTEAIARRIASPHVVVVPNGVDTLRFAPAALRPGRRPGGGTVGTLANLRPEKGLGHLVSAMELVWERHRDERLVIWGDGPLRGELERRVAALGWPVDAVVRGATTTPVTALRGFDVFVLPSLSEACSNVLLEAMATGLPVVATRVGGTPAVIEDDVNGLLVPPADPPALAHAILRLVENPALAARLGRAARATVEMRFDVGRMLGRIEALYDVTLHGSAPALRSA